MYYNIYVLAHTILLSACWHRDGSETDLLDVHEVRAWWQLLDEEALDWEAVMGQASSDDVRLALIERSCTHRVGAAFFVDGQRIKVGSRGQTGWTAGT